MSENARTPAQVYCLVFGVVLVIAGIVGFFTNSSFGTGEDAPRDALIGLFDVNGWHNVVHLLSGLAALAVAGSRPNARLFAFGFGGVYVLVTILGLAAGGSSTLFGLVAVNTEDNFLHLAIAAAGILAGVATPSDAPDTRVPSPSI
jgi:Domain of unknown function (DUF4383)